MQNYYKKSNAITKFGSACRGGKRYSFQQYNERVNQLAHYLLQSGVQRGDRIGILCKNNHPFPSVMMASLKIGAVCIPLNHQLTAYELETIVKEAKLKVLVIDEEFHEALKIDAVKEIPYVIQTTKEGFGSFELTLQEQPSTEPNVEVHEDDDAIYLFTSGTTGQAKACVIGHKTYIIILQRLQDKEKFRQENAFYPCIHCSI